MKNILVNFLLVLASVAASLLIAELIIAVFFPQPVLQATAPDIFFVKYDEEIGWVNKEGAEGSYIPNSEMPATHVRINELGYRGKPVSIEKPRGKKRILFIGDSNTFGYGIEESQRFSDLLAQRLPGQYEVLNLGVFGYGTDQEALFFERDGLRYQPDLVILAFSAGDLSDNMNSINWGVNKPFFKIENNRLVLHNSPVPRSSPFMKTSSRASLFKTFLYRHSHLYRFILRRLIATNPYIFDSVQEMNKTEALTVTAAIIKGVDTLCRMSNCRFVVLFMSHGEWIAALKKNPDLVVGYYPALKNILSGVGVTIIDTADAFVRNHSDNDPLFFRNDPVHLTAGGNQLTADILYQSLKKSGFFGNHPLPSKEKNEKAAVGSGKAGHERVY